MARTPRNAHTPSDGANQNETDHPERSGFDGAPAGISLDRVRLVPHVVVLADTATGIPWGLDTVVGWAVPEGPAEVVVDLRALVPDPSARAAVGARLRHRVLRQLAVVDPLSPVRAVRIVFRLTAQELTEEDATEDFLDEVRVWGLGGDDVAVVVTDLAGLAPDAAAQVATAVARLERRGVVVGVETATAPSSDVELPIAPALVVGVDAWSVGGREVRPTAAAPVALSALIARRDLLL